MPTGNRNITLVKSGYQTKTVWVDVPTGIKVLAPITLTPGGGPADTGTLYIASVPSGAEIYIDGVLSGTTNQFVTDIPTGNRNITLVKSGYQTKTVWVDVPTGIKVLAPITLTPGGGPADTGTLYIASVPSGAGSISTVC
ncbi:MAG: PEGA domain-containing protein [Methanolinea sp.]|nr:MAG: PEGA domain-containing protein [Methanolinea sp.]